MDACAACGTRLEDGITRCPQCGANLCRRGAFLQLAGWATAMVSLIPLALGLVVLDQSNFVPLGFGISMALAGVIMVAVARGLGRGSPPATRPLSIPEVPSTARPAPEAKSGGGTAHGERP